MIASKKPTHSHAAFWGVADEYTDWQGNQIPVNPQIQQAILEVLQAPPTPGPQPAMGPANGLPAFVPSAIQQGRRLCGLAIQLYTLRSSYNWGIGDFGDLRRLVLQAKRLGLDCIGVSPVHALFPAEPEHASPYSPSHRGFLNVLHIDVDWLAKGLEAPPTSRPADAELAALRQPSSVDYSGVAALKLGALRRLFEHFETTHLSHNTPAAKAFHAFCKARGMALQQHAVFDAIHATQLSLDPNCWGWPVWPLELRNPDSAAVREFASREHREVRCNKFMQWCAHHQLQTVQREALAAGMQIGLYLDVAVGADAKGSEIWTNQALYRCDASVGAPPDPMAPLGQDWGFPPMDPHVGRASAFRALRDNLDASMRLGGAVRLDHAIALRRLWWIPRSCEGNQAGGAFVQYPLPDLLDLIAAVSRQHQTLVVAEDLGTLPVGLSEALAAQNMYSYRVMLFEQVRYRFKKPASYPTRCLATVTTHDLPTLAGWWQGNDIPLREQLGALGSSSVAELTHTRSLEKVKLLASLHEAGYVRSRRLHDMKDMTPELSLGIHSYLAESPAAIVMLQLDDVALMEHPVNVPGTHLEYPNWRRKLGTDTQDLLEQREVRNLLRAVVVARRVNRSPLQVRSALEQPT
ncbi:MAG: 4-alpha-glucanotransferase [Pseudomonadota bacterium]